MVKNLQNQLIEILMYENQVHEYWADRAINIVYYRLLSPKYYVFIAVVDDTMLKRKSYVLFKKTVNQMEKVFAKQSPLLLPQDDCCIIKNNQVVVKKKFSQIYLYH